MLLFVASLLESHARPKVTASAKATVRIEQAVRATRKEWDRQPALYRREIIRKDEHGNVVLLRIVDYP